MVCTGSTDGLINVFDISTDSEDNALTSTFNTEHRVHKLNWHKDVYEKDIISCITDSSDFNSYESVKSDLVAKFERAHITEAIKRKSATNCNLVSCHNLADGGMFLLAASNYNKGLCGLFNCKTKKLVPHGDFGNKQIIRESIYEPQSNLLLTAGESGIITLWSPLTADQPAPKSRLNNLKAKSKKSHTITPY